MASKLYRGAGAMHWLFAVKWPKLRPAMSVSPEDEARGLKAYEQARAFERLRSWRLPLTFTVFALVPAISGVAMWFVGYFTLAWINFGIAAFLAWTGRFQFKQLEARYARNLRLLAEMEREHGDALPWVKVEHHFAELEKLKREIGQ